MSRRVIFSLLFGLAIAAMLYVVTGGRFLFFPIVIPLPLLFFRNRVGRGNDGGKPPV